MNCTPKVGHHVQFLGCFFMSKYTAQFKQKVIKYYLSGSAGYRLTGERYGVGVSAVRQWVAAYRHHGLASTKAKYSVYTADFKMSVLQHMARHGLSYGETAAQFDIRNRGAIAMWERAYNLGGLAALTNRKRGRRPAMDKKPTLLVTTHQEAGVKPSYAQLEEELAYLRMENAYLKKLDALILKEKQEAQQAKRKSSKN
jgi:transposase